MAVEVVLDGDYELAPSEGYSGIINGWVQVEGMGKVKAFGNILDELAEGYISGLDPANMDERYLLNQYLEGTWVAYTYMQGAGTEEGMCYMPLAIFQQHIVDTQ